METFRKEYQFLIALILFALLNLGGLLYHFSDNHLEQAYWTAKIIGQKSCLNQIDFYTTQYQRTQHLQPLHEIRKILYQIEEDLLEAIDYASKEESALPGIRLIKNNGKLSEKAGQYYEQLIFEKNNLKDIFLAAEYLQFMQDKRAANLAPPKHIRSYSDIQLQLKALLVDLQQQHAQLAGALETINQQKDRWHHFFALFFSLSSLACIAWLAFQLYRHYYRPVSRLLENILQTFPKWVPSSSQKNKGGQALEAVNYTLKAYAQTCQNIGLLASSQTIAAEALKEIPVGTELVQIQEKMHQFHQEEARRLWYVEGIQQIAQRLNHHQKSLSPDEDMLLDFVRILCKHAGLNQGWAYQLRLMGKPAVWKLKLYACYAFDKKKYIDKAVDATQGLLGQCVQEKHTLYIEDVPEEYATITSGLGTGNPRYLMICPIKVHEEMFGAIELLSFKPITDRERNFIEAACEQLANTLSLINMSKNTQKLLEESKKTNDTLKNKEEQMQRYNEQLMAEFQQVSAKLFEIEQKNDYQTYFQELSENNMAIHAELGLKEERLLKQQEKLEEALKNEQKLLKKLSRLEEKQQRLIAQLLDYEQVKQQLDVLRCDFKEKKSMFEQAFLQIKALKEEQNLAKQRLEVLEELIPQASLDLHGHILECSPTLLGLDAEYLQGMHAQWLFKESAWEDLFAKVQQTEQPLIWEEGIRQADGGYLPMRLWLQPMFAAGILYKFKLSFFCL
jgi:hypothetical protein